MNKNKIDELLPRAYEILNEVGIAIDGKIQKTYRGQISSFGAAISEGSLISAVAFFSDKGASTVDRKLITDSIYMLITGGKKPDNAALFEYVKEAYKNNKEAACKEEILNAAISLKLAMNLYTLVK